MKAETFYAFGYALGLSESGMAGLLDCRLEPPQVDRIDEAFVKVTLSWAVSAPGYDAPSIVKRTHMIKWMRELNRLRNEKQK